MFNIVNNSTLIKVDCIVRKRDRFEIERFARRRKTRLGPVEFWVIGREDLILSKLRWASESRSERQFEDIRRLMESGTDDASFHDEADKMGLTEVVKAFEEWKTRAEK